VEQQAAGVKLRPYDPAAPRIFAELERTIRRAVGFPIAVEHVGSTAVAGLGGKGIIDCLVIAERPEEASEVCAILRRQGFAHNTRERPEEDRWFASGSLSTEGHGALHVHIHITYAGSRCAQDTLAFRDHLRKHPADAARYFRLKHGWRAQAGASASRYTELKTGFVEKILRRTQE
jgi:GrpB-like predicted nucleotidyltransferase (UPF0157 family)